MIQTSFGIGLRHPHYQEMLSNRPDIDWLEVHSENYFEPHGQHRWYLRQLAEHYPISLHGIGLSLGSVDPLNLEHLEQLKQLVTEFSPMLVSEHLSWSSFGQQYFNDLLPLPYTREMLELFCGKVDQTQQYLGRQILIENPSAYLQFSQSYIPEWEFLGELAHRSGCGLLLDINNIYVSAINQGFSAETYLDAIDTDKVGEVHLAGYTRKRLPQGELLIDTHGKPVSAPVWQLFERFCRHAPLNAPVLIEWDTDIPPLHTLLSEAHKAARIHATAIHPYACKEFP